MFKLLLSILGRTKNIVVLGFGSVLLFIFLRVIPQLHIIRDFWQLKRVDFSRKLEVAYQYSFGEFSLWNVFDTTATIILTIATVVNIIIFVVYFKRQRKVLNKGSIAATSLGMILGMFGVGCVSCGAIVLAPMLSALGLLGALELLPFVGRELVVLGILFVLGSIIYLLNKLNKPMIC